MFGCASVDLCLGVFILGKALFVCVAEIWMNIANILWVLSSLSGIWLSGASGEEFGCLCLCDVGCGFEAKTSAYLSSGDGINVQ